ncbi:hypothetical protein ACKUB1_14360 [Methanospirillum stamsii]|uniref:hypothetical protein n=1 Tax=Methanospirillum stamsii TaxID=1277351 RepID=UPI0015E8449A|nr:hypothetical protein [Methanospirillum stamsii]
MTTGLSNKSKSSFFKDWNEFVSSSTGMLMDIIAIIHGKTCVQTDELVRHMLPDLLHKV